MWNVYFEVAFRQWWSKALWSCPPAALGLHLFAFTSSHFLISLTFSPLCFVSLSGKMQGVAAVDSDSEQKFIEGTLAEAPSPVATEPQTPMDADKASIYR